MLKTKDIERARAGKPFRNARTPAERYGLCNRCGHYIPESKWKDHEKECKGRLD